MLIVSPIPEPELSGVRYAQNVPGRKHRKTFKYYKTFYGKMSTYRPAQIFASISTTPKVSKSQPVIAEEEVINEKTVKNNDILVSATGELSLPPDRCRVTITVSSKKDQVQDAKNSVSRRLDYVMQTIHNHQVKDSETSTSKLLRRVDGLYFYDAEVTVTFLDFDKCQAVCNILVEKLDDNVKITPPEFFQSSQRLENLRRQTSLLAVSNARQKAGEMAKFLHASVGKPISIREESCSEWEGTNDSAYDPDAPITIQQRRDQATVHVNVKVSATFELKSKSKTKVQPKT